MNYQGIITGIGDKSTNKNVIEKELDTVIAEFFVGNPVLIDDIVLPEQDAKLYNFIIDKNTIIEGLEINDNILSSGTCILCGYRGIIEENITLTDFSSNPYIYGKFNINFDENKKDSFYIVTLPSELSSSVNPENIEVAGEYYLLLHKPN
jgi:hypothetical protein